MGQKNVIELNGRKYDALSGALLGESRVRTSTVSRATASRRGRAIDGFMHPNSKTMAPAPTVVKPQVKPPNAALQLPEAAPLKKTAPKGKKMDISRTVSHKSSLSPHQPQRPQTLMRHVVKKPATTMKPALKSTTASEVMAAPTSAIAKPLEKKLSASNVNPFRLARSRQVAKSHHIRRFEQPQQPAAPRAGTPVHRVAGRYASRPAYQDLVAPQVIVQKSTAASRPSTPVTPQRERSTNDIFEAALAHATSHEEQAPLRAKHQQGRHRRLVNILAGVGAFLLIGGFVGYMNMANIEMRIASMRAGFHAQIPSFQPTGYALDGGIESSEGHVAMSFRSGDRQYTVVQEASDWNSSTLLDQTVAQRGEPSQTIQNKGRTIYIYDDANATWVNGGVRYQISGNAPLSADEIVSLATSM